MSKRVSEFAAAVPISRVTDASDTGYFFAGEAARMLGVENIRYGQLRAIYDLVREQAGITATEEEKRKWARFTSTDLAAALEVVRICVDRVGLENKAGVRIALVHLKRACTRLRRQGLSNPLLQARLDYIDGRVVAHMNGVTFDTSNGQILVEDAIERIEKWLSGRAIDPKLRELVERERLQVVGNHETPELTVGVDEADYAPRRVRRKAS
jgi:hypothetical protein